MRKFLRTGTERFKRLGKGRKKKQRWRRARGIHNKIREKRKGRRRKVDVGFRTSKESRGKIGGKIPVIVRNLKEAEKIDKGSLVIAAKMGKKKRILIENKVREKGGEILNKIKIGEVQENES